MRERESVCVCVFSLHLQLTDFVSLFSTANYGCILDLQL